jgi:hypothetical protein
MLDHASRFLFTCEALSSTREDYAFTVFDIGNEWIIRPRGEFSERCSWRCPRLRMEISELQQLFDAWVDFMPKAS